MSISWNVCFCVDIVIVCICQDVYGLCVYVFLYVCGGKCVNMSECVYVFMYLYACKSDEGEREREREISPWRAIVLKNVDTCLHDPIILYLANRF